MLFLVIAVVLKFSRQTLAVFNGMSNKSEVHLHSFAVTSFVVVLIASWQRLELCQNGMVVRYRRRRRQRKVHVTN